VGDIDDIHTVGRPVADVHQVSLLVDLHDIEPGSLALDRRNGDVRERQRHVGPNNRNCEQQQDRGSCQDRKERTRLVQVDAS
jgi:hypothetical protein